MSLDFSFNERGVSLNEAKTEGGGVNLNPFIFILYYDDKLHARDLSHGSFNFGNLGHL